MDKISVLMPTYNVEPYVEEAVLSILNQSYENIELIIVDDCSSDNTYKILNKLSKIDNRIKLFRNDKNKKICFTLNEALKYSTGKYIARMDGDDVCEYDRLEKQINYLKKNPDIDLVGSSIIGIDENGNVINKKKYISSFKLIKKIIPFSSPVLHIWIAKRELYEKLGGYREIPYVEDYDFLLRAISEGYKISNLSSYYGYKVRMRSGNTVDTVGVKQRRAFDYSYKLYKQRKKYKADKFNQDDFYEYIDERESEKKKYKNSQELLKKSIKMKAENDKRWIKYSVLAAIKSKYQFKYIYSAFMVRILSKFDVDKRGNRYE